MGCILRSDPMRVFEMGNVMSETAGEDTNRQAVLVHIRLADDGFGTSDECDTIMDLGDEIGAFLEKYGVGEFDGDAFGMGFATLYFYGSDADRLRDAILLFIKAFKPPSGSYLVTQYGESGATETRFDL
jgi:hypothetical protein